MNAENPEITPGGNGQGQPPPNGPETRLNTTPPWQADEVEDDDIGKTPEEMGLGGTTEAPGTAATGDGEPQAPAPVTPQEPLPGTRVAEQTPTTATTPRREGFVGRVVGAVARVAGVGGVQIPGTRETAPAGAGQQTGETRGAGGTGDGGTPGTPRTPEAPPPPEPPRGPEWLTSPERGREIVLEIIRLETTLPYEERYKLKTGPLSSRNSEIYNERNGTYLDQVYADLKDYTRALRRIRNQRDAWNPITAYREIKRALERIARGESPEASQQVRVGRVRERGERPPVLPTESLNALFEKYKDDSNVEAVQGDMATWFQEARSLGLLDRADAIFSSTYRRITDGGISEDDVPAIIEKARESAKKATDGVFRMRKTDSAVAALQGIAEAYSTRTYDIFQLILSGERHNSIEGEFRFGRDLDEEEDTEKYWRPGHYPKLYEIIAKRKWQFSRAKDSFLSMITRGHLGKSPGELYEHFNNFTEKFSQTASAEGIEDDYIMESRLELGGRGFVFGGDYSFETYDMKSANQFLMAMALHEGPQRWVRVARSGNGGVGAHLRKLDYDPRVVLMHNPGGSRGQLLSDTVTQHYLHAQIRDILIEEGMGIVLKDYDPRDADSVAYAPESIRVLNTPEAEQARELALKANVERIGIHQPPEEFKGLYEGFDRGDAHLVNYQRYGNLGEKELRQLAPRLRRSVIIGKVKFMLRGHEGKNKGQLLGVIDNLIAEGKLSDKDKRFWEEAYDQSKANFDTAFQMVGAMGEKARRGGGVFFVDRKGEHGRRFVDNLPVYLGEMFIQYAETRTKIAFANASAVVRTEEVEKTRASAIKQIHENGFEAKLTFPRLLFNTDENSPNFGEVIGLDGNQTETVDFDTATDPENPLNKWLNHTYLSYQPENRHQVTNPDVLKAAKRRRIRLLRPDLVRGPDQDQYETLADMRLILDPTLNRVPSLQDTDMPEGMSSQQAEILLSDAVVEASNYGHWGIVRKLNAAFMDPEGNPLKMRTGYNLEDYSGIARFIIKMRQFMASNPKRFARRYAAELANLPVNVSSMPDQWGQHGVLGAIEMFADPVGDMSEQKIASQFAITKWVEQMRIGNMLFGALVGHVDSERGFSIEGLFEKPTNNSDKLQQLQKKLNELDKNAEGKGNNYDIEDEFMYAVLESFDRLWIVLKLIRTMESDTRNAQGALYLENQDILKNGKVDPELLERLKKDRDTGSSRHTEKQFFDAYIKWLTSDEAGGGAETYPGEKWWYKKLLAKTILDPQGKKTRVEWLFDKMGR